MILSIMKKFTIITKMLCFLLFFSLYIQTFSSETNLYEEIPVSLEINEVDLEEEVSAYFSQEEMIPLVNLDEIMKTFFIVNYSLSESYLTYQLNGVDKKIKLHVKKINNLNLISMKELEKVFKKTEIKWDISSMKISIVTKEKLPWEFEQQQQILHERIDREKNKNTDLYKGSMHLFTPGMLTLNYSKNNIKDSKDNYLSLHTVNQVLYGSLTQSTSITDNDIELDNISWSRELYDNRMISVGDEYSSLPFNFNNDNSYMGLKIYGKDSWDGTAFNIKKNEIEGVAPDGLMIELYENGILKDYQISKNNKFNFKVPSLEGIQRYEVWIYNKDRSISKHKISLYEDKKFLKKNTFDYQLELGQGKENSKFNPYNLNLMYGLTDNLTLGAGTYNVESTTNKKFNNYSFIYRFNPVKFLSNKLEGDYSSNLDDSKENIYRMSLISSNKYITNTIGIKNNTNLDEKLQTDEYDQKIYDHIQFELFSMGTSLNYESAKNTVTDKVRDTYEVDLHKDLFNNFLTANLNLSENTYNDSSNSENLGLRLSHNIKNLYMNRFIDKVVFGYDTGEGLDKYEVMIGKTKGINDNFDYYISADIDRYEARVGFTFNYIFGKKISATTSTEWLSDNPKIETSVGASATVDFESSKFLVTPNEYADSSLHGTAYIDSNNNGFYDPNDEAVEGVSLATYSKRVKTNDRGEFFLSNIHSLNVKDLHLKITNDEYLGGYKINDTIKFETFPGESLEINVPLIQIKTVVGDIEFGDDFYLEDVVDFLKHSKVYITNLKTGEIHIIKLKDESFIKELEVGKYSIEIARSKGLNIPGIKKYFTIQPNEDLEKYLTFHISKDKSKKQIITMSQL